MYIDQISIILHFHRRRQRRKQKVNIGSGKYSKLISAILFAQTLNLDLQMRFTCLINRDQLSVSIINTHCYQVNWFVILMFIVFN